MHCKVWMGNFPMYVKTAAVAACCFLASCVPYHSVSVATTSYQSSPLCCGSFGGMSFEQLSSEHPQSFGLDSTSPAFDFAEYGKSYFKAFELPVTGPATLVVSSDSFQNGYPSRGIAVFYPVVTFLDSNKMVVGSIDWAKAPKEFLQHDVGGAYVRLSGEIPANARYAIVHTNASYIGADQILHYRTRVTSPAIGVLVALTGGPDTTFAVTGAPDAPGNGLEIEVEPRSNNG